MTQQEINDWFTANGVGSVAADEAPYIFEHYGGPSDEIGQLGALERSLGSYQQRSLSGGDRSQGGYSTDENDPAQGNAPARYDSNNSGRLGPVMGGGGGAWGGGGWSMPQSMPGLTSAMPSGMGYPSGYVGGPMQAQWPTGGVGTEQTKLNPARLEQIMQYLNQQIGQNNGPLLVQGDPGLTRLIDTLRRLGVI